MPSRFSLVPASYLYLLREGAVGTEVLLQLRQNTGYMDGHWAAAAAGHVERGETAYDALGREAREELDVEVTSPELVTIMQRTQGADPIDERIDFFFTAREWRGEPRIMEPRKCAEIRWWPLADLPTPMPPHEVEVLVSLVGIPLLSYSTLGFEREIR